jgi:hypothetical protein
MFLAFTGTVSSTELVADAVLCNMNDWDEEPRQEQSLSILQGPLRTLGTVDPGLLEN